MSEIIKYLKNWLLAYNLKLYLPCGILAVFVGWFVSRSETRRIIIFKVGVISCTAEHIILAVLILLEIILLYVFVYTAKETSEKTETKPYKIDLGFHSKDEIIEQLERRLSLIKFNDECSYASIIRTVGVDWRVFIFLFDENNHNYDLGITDQYIEKITVKTGFKPTVYRHKGTTFGYSMKGRIMVYDRIPEAIINTAQNSVMDKIISEEPTVDFLIDLTEGFLYIPRLNTRVDVYYRYSPYLYAIEQIGEYFGDC